MIKKVITVTNTLGVHARPASAIVKTATKFKSDIAFLKDGIVADAKSIMNVMMLAAAKNSRIIIQANGKDEEDAVQAIEDLFRNNFSEE